MKQGKIYNYMEKKMTFKDRILEKLNKEIESLKKEVYPYMGDKYYDKIDSQIEEVEKIIDMIKEECDADN